MEQRGGKLTGKHGDGIDIVEFTIALAVEGGPDVGNEDLRTLHDADFAAFEGCLIAKASEVAG